MHFTYIKSTSGVFYWEAQSSNPVCHFQMPVEANDNGRDTPTQGEFLPLLLKLPVPLPDSATFKRNFFHEPLYCPRTL